MDNWNAIVKDGARISFRNALQNASDAIASANEMAAAIHRFLKDGELNAMPKDGPADALDHAMMIADDAAALDARLKEIGELLGV